MSWRVKTSYSRYCRQPATRSLRCGIQPLSSQNTSMQRCVAASASSVSSAADSDTDRKTARVLQRLAACRDPRTISFW